MKKHSRLNVEIREIIASDETTIKPVRCRSGNGSIIHDPAAELGELAATVLAESHTRGLSDDSSWDVARAISHDTIKLVMMGSGETKDRGSQTC